MPGPPPKRSDERVRRNLPEGPLATVTVIGDVIPPDLALGDVHPLVMDLYDSMQLSAQAKFMEPSDWQMARITCHELNRYLRSTKPSAVLLTALNSMLSNLLVTEGDRRRLRIEVERQSEGAKHKEASVSDMLKYRLGITSPVSGQG